MAKNSKKEFGSKIKEEFSIFYPAISAGTFAITAGRSFFVPFLNLLYTSSNARVGTKPKATHNVDSSISIP